ncbi:MAG: hypothetical protein JW776_01270 [Candidatus Lokiarchaeota archaeon]|nr:hypothetical protein [Candidatus Lokiarchaeota archaeon]
MSGSDKIEHFEHEIESPEFERHDRYNFEVKLDYTIEPSQRKNGFLLEMFCFLPKSLHINEETYTQFDFYSDLNLYMRYKTPELSISALINPNNTLSPLNRIRTLINSQNRTKSQILYEIRLFGAMVRACVRDNLENLGNKIELDSSKMNKNEQEYLEFLSFISPLLTKINQLTQEMETNQIDNEILNAFHYVSQFIHVQIEIRFNKFLAKFDSLLSDKIKNKTIQCIESTRADRKEIMSPLSLDLIKTGESFEYGEGLLKKFTQRVLYLEQKRKKREKRLKQLFYSVAAGLAMVVSVLLTLLLLEPFQEYSTPFFLAAVVIYVFKDRIKSLIKLVSNRTLRIIISDRTHQIRDPFERTHIGSMRETMRFLEENEIPQEIAKSRQRNQLTIEKQENLENVFKYKKIMQLDAFKLLKIHEREGDIHDIIRFNIKNIIRYADDPFKEYPIWNKDTDDVEYIKQYKIYHINLIFRVRTLNKTTTKIPYLKKVRIVLDQDGIKRLEYPEID